MRYPCISSIKPYAYDFNCLLGGNRDTVHFYVEVTNISFVRKIIPSDFSTEKEKPESSVSVCSFDMAF